ncbi:MAG TPA: outer membrane beta-barrel protein [Burkholderiales bacterium]|nr:outer membrane beta-barrel protein [Burkholderiales bacterium]
MLALCGLALTQALQAAPADDIKALVEKGDARGAYELGKKHPDQLGNPVFDFYFGIAAIDSGRAGEGVLALERYIINFPDNVQARLELARGYFILGEDARAREEFSEVLKAKPPAAVVANIERYLDAIRARESAYRTTAGAFVELGLGYDSNINGGVSNANVNLPNFGLVTVAPGGVKISSSFTQLTGGANVIHPIAPGVAIFGSAAADFKIHNIHQEFDQRNLNVAGGISWLREQDLFRASLSFNTLEVDYNRFRDVTGLTGEWTRQLDELQSVNAFVQYATLDYAGGNNVRDSHLAGAGAGYRRSFIGPWRPLLVLSASYAEEDNRRGRDDLARDIYSIRAAVGVTPAPKWAANAGATYQLSDYRAQDPLFTTTRRDKYYALDASVSYAFTRNLSLRGEVLLSKNESNIALFEYKREVAAVKVRYEFK